MVTVTVTVDLPEVTNAINQLKELIMSTASELIATLNAVLATQRKTADEIAALQGTMNTLQETIAALEAQLAAATDLPAELIAAVAAVKLQADAVDALIPDLPAVPNDASAPVGLRAPDTPRAS